MFYAELSFGSHEELLCHVIGKSLVGWVNCLVFEYTAPEINAGMKTSTMVKAEFLH